MIGVGIDLIIMSNFRIINNFGGQNVSKFNIGTGISGIGVIALRAIITLLMPS